MEANNWSIEVHSQFNFNDFMSSLPPLDEILVYERIRLVLGQRGNELAGTHWSKALGDGLFEFRISNPGVLVRIFFAFKAGRVILLLGAYDKKRDSSARRQQKEIETAKKRLKKL
jgi:phage-related protein